MTPTELLEEVKGLFQVLYVQDPLPKTLLKKALSVYQNKAGPRSVIEIPADADPVSVAAPADFLSVTVCVDNNGNWHPVTVAGGILTVVTTEASAGPYTIHYFIDLFGRVDDPDYNLPSGGIYLLMDYLFGLISIPNTQRERQVSSATGMATELPSDEELRQRLIAIEIEMEDTSSFLPMVSVS
jgi:hypothetical protein